MNPRRASARASQERHNRDYPQLWCSWGRHHFLPLRHLNEQLADGVMCFACQLKIAENVMEVIPVPEMSLAMHRREQDKRREQQEMRAAETKVKTSDPSAPGLVYYIRINGHIKIGYTGNLKQRSRNYPPESELVAVEPGTRYTERDRHQQFHRDLARGREWFVESPALIEHMALLQEANGVPSVLMHRYRTRQN